MAEKLELIGKILLDSKDAEQSIGTIKQSLQSAREVQAKVTAEFGATSIEAEKAAQDVKLFEDSLKFAINPIAAINDELEATKQQLAQVTAEFGEASPQAEKLRNDIVNLESGISALKDPVRFFNDELKAAEAELQNTIQQFGELSPQALKAAEDVGAIKLSIEEIGKTNLTASVEEFNIKLQDAEATLQQTINTFGELSPEAQQAASVVDSLKASISAINIVNLDEPVIQLKQSLIDAENTLENTINTYGEYSAEALTARDSVNQIKLSLNEVAGVDVFNPVKLLTEQLEVGNQTLDVTKQKFGDTSQEALKVSESVQQTENDLKELNNINIANPVIGLKEQLTQAKDKLSETIQTFGALSPEALEAANEVERIKTELNEISNTQIDEPIKNVKQQLKEANVELQNAVQKFGLGSEEAAKAAKKVAELKDTIGDAKTLTDAFNPDAKFKGFANAIQGAAGAFTALQGAQAVFGAESENVAKTLAKVQGALALSQGINGLLEAKDSFVALGNSAKTALSGIRAGIAATGIGVLLVALGAIVAYWDDIKGLVSGVSSEQEKLNELGKKNLDAEQEKLSALDGQEQQLKAQGKSEREILTLKMAQTDAAIQAAEVNLQNQKATKKAQVDAAKRNQDILSGILKFLTTPINLLYKTVANIVNSLIEGLNYLPGVDIDFRMNGQLIEEGTNLLSKAIFDPEETAKDGDEAIKEADKTLNSLKEKRAGFQNQIAGIDKAASDKAKADAKKSAEERKKLQDEIDKDALERRKRALDFQGETDKLILQNRLDAIKNQQDKERFQLEVGYQGQIDALLKSSDEEEKRLKESLNKKLLTQDEYDAEIIKLQNANTEQRKQIDIKYQTDSIELTKKFGQQKKDIESETEDIIFESKIAQLEEGLQKEQALLTNSQTKRLDAQKKLLEQGIIDEDEFNKRKLALQTIFETEQKNLTDKFELESLDKRTDELNKVIESTQASYAQKQEALRQEQELIDQARAEGLLKDEDYNAKLKELSDKRIETEVAEKEARAKIVGEIGEIATGITKLFAGAFEKNKGLQIASILVEQASAVAKIISNTFAANARAKLELGPVAGSAFSIKNTITAGISVAQAIKAAVDGIKKIKSANAGGSPSGSASVVNQANAPLPPQAQTTALPQEQINALTQGTESQRAYVLESDVTSNQERIVRINRAARIN